MKNERIKLMSIGCLFCLVFSLFGFLLTRHEYNHYKESVNHYLYGLITVLQERYPNLSEQEIVSLLNQTGKSSIPKNLKKYGLNEDSTLLLSMENEYKTHQTLILGFTFFITLTFFVFFFWYFYRKEKALKELTNYMQELNQRNYQLGIELNGEGEISLLRNEIYKTTIMLREESELLKKDKEILKDSIAEISHQLKTPLTSILILLDNILDNPKMKEDTKRDFIHDAYTQVENIHFLIVSLLKTARLDADVVNFKQEDISVAKMLQMVLENLNALANQKKIEFKVECSEESFFKGDFHWEVEAFTNLIKNAIEYSHELGTISIFVEDNSLYTKIKIIDEGKGMNKKDIENIFKRFYKGENSHSDSAGIGLFLAKKIIEKDKGIITVTSELDKGTTFEIKYLKVN